MPKTALFVIDIQDDLAGEGNPNASPYAARVRAAGTEILKRARAAVDDAEKQKSASPLDLIFVQHDDTEGPLIRGLDSWKLVFEPDKSRTTERLVSKTDGL